MARRIMLFPVVLFSLTLFFGLAGATVTSWPTVIGSWDITGTAKAKVSIKIPSVKGRSVTLRGRVSDYFIFDPDGSFHMIDMEGTWSQSKLNFIVHIDPLDIAAYMETNIQDLLWSYGYDVAVTNVSIPKNDFTGKESKTGATISGKWDLTMNVSIYFYDFGLTGTVTETFTVTFKGTGASFVSAVGDSQAVESGQSADGMDGLLHPLVDSIMRSVLNPNADLPQ